MEKLNSVWMSDWIHAFESPWSILEKFTLANVANRNDVIFLLGSPEVKKMKYKTYGDKHRNLFIMEGFDRSLLQQVLGIDLKDHTDRLMHKLIQKVSCKCLPTGSWFHLCLRWCPECIKSGYHSVFHQFKLLNHCPFHMTRLCSKCPKCNQQFAYKFTDRGFKGSFLCDCGFSFIDIKERWRRWGEPLEIRCQHTLQWLHEKNGVGYLTIFNPKHLEFASNPIKLIVGVDGDQVHDDTISIQAGKHINRTLLECKDLPVTLDPHLRQYELENHKYHRLFAHLYEVTRDAYLTINRHLRSTVLRKHISCTVRLQFMMKEPGSNFPPICPYAYAYVFWRQSLLGYDTFYRRVSGVPHSGYTETFDAIGKPFVGDLKYLFEQYVAHYPSFSPTKPGPLSWILYKAAYHYYLQYFRNWMEEASYGAQQIIVPRGERLRELALRNMPMLLYKIPLNQEGLGVEFYMEKKRIFGYETSDFTCPFNSVKRRRLKESEIDHSPLSVAMKNIDAGIYDDEVHKSTEYARRLLIY